MPFSPVKPKNTRRSRKHFVNKNATTKLDLSSPLKNHTSAKRQHTSYELLDKFNRKTYLSWKGRCLAERKELGIGKSQQMNTLFRFWSVNLRNHFNRSMYGEFKSLALEDSKEGDNYGLQCLFRYYSYGLEKEFRMNVFVDFQELVLERYLQSKDLYGVEKLRAFVTYYKGDIPSMKHEVQEILNEYPTLDCFKKN